ncbi:MAG: type II toxin-antitoxin system RelE family toxin [Acidimicrobiales bacterium]
MGGNYELRVHGAARRALEERLPLAVALAVWEFCQGPLRDQPRRVGRELGGELHGYFSARRGAYRVIYRLDEEERTIHVVRIEHRADVYRRR